MSGRCQFLLTIDEPCNKKVILGLGLCKHCKKYYCRQHSHLEEHNCPMLPDLKIKNRANLRDTLESGRAEFSKINKI